MLLVLTLPPLAVSLDALGWAEIVAAQIRRARLSIRGEVLAAYSLWLAVSSILTLDVAAVVAVPVGLRLASSIDEQSGQDQLGAAILGSNVGSLLFPFSNLTNLILVSATGISFGAYIAVSWLPQAAAALGVGILLRWRTTRRSQEASPVQTRVSQPRQPPTVLATVAGVVAVTGAVSAVVVGLVGGDIALVFATTAAIVTGCAVGSSQREVGSRELLRSIPLAGVAVVLFAAIATAQLTGLGAHLPDLQATLPAIVALPLVALVGGLLAVTINNLPAAALGAIWLSGSSPTAVVAFLVGTNLFALATPHGSLATILSRQLGLRRGIDLGARTYLANAWRYALVSSLAALVALFVIPPR
jgi:arsenical pump membrane protein